MSRAVILKTVREQWRAALLFALALAAIEGLLAAFVVPTFLRQYSEQFLRIDFVRSVLKGVLGTEIGETIGPAAMNSFPWVHPVVLALLWAHEIAFCTTMPAGEIDRGTIDLLLSLPVSRWRHYLSHSIVWLAAGLLLVLMALAGNRVGAWVAADVQAAPTARLLIVCGNMYALYLAVGGMACLISTLSDHRGRAVGVAFGVVLISFFLNFLAPLWQPAKRVDFLSVMNYYRPMVIVRDASYPLTDVMVLMLIGAACWLAGGWIFARRDLRTS